MTGRPFQALAYLVSCLLFLGTPGDLTAQSVSNDAQLRLAIREEGPRTRPAVIEIPGEPGIYWVAICHEAAKSEALAREKSNFSQSSLVDSRKVFQRRAKVGIGVLPSDLPIEPAIVEAIRATGATVRTQSRLFHAISIEATPRQLERIAEIPQVAFFQPVSQFRSAKLALIEVPDQVVSTTPTAPSHLADQNRCTTAPLLYGLSLTQHTKMNIPALHEMGLRGAGVRIGVIDSGFRWRTHEALTSATVIAEYDFIEDDADTANSANDHPSQDRHGTQVLALIAGQSPGNLYGAAFEAEFVLAKTEDISGENRIEMDYFIAGLEFLEQQGCDIISASIVYGIFPSEPDIPFTNLDGKTEPISLAVGALYERGVVMVNAAGNNGSLIPFAPNDAYGVISVGQLTVQGDLASNSSFGPMPDGRTKPDVVTQGVQVQTVNPSTANGYTTSTSGTSFATPQVAGLAALILQAHPDWTPHQVRQAILSSASQSATPSNGRGWGTPNGVEAIQHDGSSPHGLRAW